MLGTERLKRPKLGTEVSGFGVPKLCNLMGLKRWQEDTHCSAIIRATLALLLHVLRVQISTVV